jgi:hypothetical protein
MPVQAAVLMKGKIIKGYLVPHDKDNNKANENQTNNNM